jgi:hypothetical protein
MCKDQTYKVKYTRKGTSEATQVINVRINFFAQLSVSEKTWQKTVYNNKSTSMETLFCGGIGHISETVPLKATKYFNWHFMLWGNYSNRDYKNTEEVNMKNKNAVR